MPRASTGAQRGRGGNGGGQQPPFACQLLLSCHGVWVGPEGHLMLYASLYPCATGGAHMHEMHTLGVGQVRVGRGWCSEHRDLLLSSGARSGHTCDQGARSGHTCDQSGGSSENGGEGGIGPRSHEVESAGPLRPAGHLDQAR